MPAYTFCHLLFDIPWRAPCAGIELRLQFSLQLPPASVKFKCAVRSHLARRTHWQLCLISGLHGRRNLAHRASLQHCQIHTLEVRCIPSSLLSPSSPALRHPLRLLHLRASASGWNACGTRNCTQSRSRPVDTGQCAGCVQYNLHNPAGGCITSSNLVLRSAFRTCAPLSGQCGAASRCLHRLDAAFLCSPF